MKFAHRICLFFLAISMMLLVCNAFADVIVMRNGDRIEGQVIEENRFEMKVFTGQPKPIVVNKEFIRRHEKEDIIKKEEFLAVESIPEVATFSGEEQVDYDQIETKKMKTAEDIVQRMKEEERMENEQVAVREEVVKNEVAVWERKVSLGYTERGGNVESSDLAFGLNINRKKDFREFTGFLGGSFASSDRKSTSRKFNAMLRHAYSFGKNKDWYGYYKFEGDHDRFSNIEQRYVRSLGLGYWFSDSDEFKAMVEAGVGYETTKYIDSKDKDDDILAVSRGYLEKKIKNSVLSQEFIFYPSLKDTSEYRIHSETAISNPINDKVFLKLSLIDDYDSRPEGTTEKNDYRLTSSLDVKF